MTAGARPTKRSPTRGAIAITLAVISSIFVSMAVDAFWLNNAIFDEDGFVERVAPLPKDPAVSTAIAASTVQALNQDGALQAQVADALPDELTFLASTFTGFAAELVFDLTKALVESDVFTSVWTAIVEATHRALTAALEGRSDDVSFDLGIGAELIVNRLEESGITLFSDLTIGEIVLLQADQLAGPRTIANVFNTSLWLFPLIALLLLLAAVAVDWDRTRSIQVFGFSVAITVLASAALLAATRTVFVGGADTIIVREARRAVWDALADGYVVLAAAVAGIGLVIGVGTWLGRRQMLALLGQSAE